MNHILIAYSTNGGSTGEVAETIADELRQAGRQVEVCELTKIGSLESYESMVIGAPMIFGWHAQARRFMRRNRQLLVSKKIVYFACALRLTNDLKAKTSAIPMTIDPGLVSQPLKPEVLNLKERFTSVGHYLSPMLTCAPGITPLSVAFFNGKLDLRRLKWWQLLFVLGIVQGKPGDYRDWDFIRQWSRSLSQVI